METAESVTDSIPIPFISLGKETEKTKINIKLKSKAVGFNF